MKKSNPGQVDSVTCIVIFTQVLGRKKYITGESLIHNNKIIPILDQNPAEAKGFETEAEARRYTSRINNVHNREFKYEKATMPASVLAPVALPAEKALV